MLRLTTGNPDMCRVDWARAHGAGHTTRAEYQGGCERSAPLPASAQSARTRIRKTRGTTRITPLTFRYRIILPLPLAAWVYRSEKSVQAITSLLSAPWEDKPDAAAPFAEPRKPRRFQVRWWPWPRERRQSISSSVATARSGCQPSRRGQLGDRRNGRSFGPESCTIGQSQPG